MEAGALSTGADFYHAAMLFQHGADVEDYWRAHDLAKQAVYLGDARGRWLAAAAYDRWLMRQDKPQKYGTQYSWVDGRYVLWQVDPSTTDDERTEWDVPALHIAQKIAEQLAQQGDPTDAFLEDPPLAVLDVPGLRVEVKRWLGPSPPAGVPKPKPVPLTEADGAPGMHRRRLRLARTDTAVAWHAPTPPSPGWQRHRLRLARTDTTFAWLALDTAFAWPALTRPSPGWHRHRLRLAGTDAAFAGSDRHRLRVACTGYLVHVTLTKEKFRPGDRYSNPGHCARSDRSGRRL